MKYTRFQSFTISASTTSISSCSGASSLSFSHLYTRYTKSHTNDCETAATTPTTDVSDESASEVTWNPVTYGSISYQTYTIGKNGSVSAASRYDDVTAYVTFRGSRKNSNSVRITQGALTGDYYYWKTGETKYYSYDRLGIDQSNFNCTGGYWTATGYYTTHKWDVYRWMDNCGTNYDNVTENRNHTYPSRSEFVSSGSVGSIDCSTLTGDYSHTEVAATWHGYSVSWTQACKKCSCRGEYSAYTYSPVTTACTALQATVNYTWTAHTETANAEGICIDVEHPETTGSGSYNVTWTCNTLPSDPHVTVTGAPCCSAGTAYTYNNVSLECGASSQRSMYVAWECVVHNPDGTTTTTSGSNEVTIPAVTCNDGSERVVQNRVVASTLADAKPQITQKGGCSCSGCYTITPTEGGCNPTPNFTATPK